MSEISLIHILWGGLFLNLAYIVFLLIRTQKKTKNNEILIKTEFVPIEKPVAIKMDESIKNDDPEKLNWWDDKIQPQELSKSRRVRKIEHNQLFLSDVDNTF